MLKVYYGDMQEDKFVYNTSVRFDNTYEPKWLEDTMAKKIIKDIDHSEVVSGECIESPVLGQIPPTKLSGGTKTLLLIMNEPNTIFNASTCGDNCAKWLLEIGKIKDITINLRHFMDFGDGPFEIYVENTKEIVHNTEELFPITDNIL